MPHQKHLASKFSFSTQDYLRALIVVVIWGMNFVVMKFALSDLTPFQMGAARYFFAVFPLIFFHQTPEFGYQVVGAVRFVCRRWPIWLCFCGAQSGDDGGFGIGIDANAGVFYGLAGFCIAGRAA
jgi:hypothetical protein